MLGFPTLALERQEGRGKGRKTRSFAVRLLGYLTADRLWDAPAAGPAVHPVWIAYFGTDGESGPFTANFRVGREARTRNERFRIPKKAAHRWTAAKVPGGVVTVGYLPELFHLEPPGPFVDREVRFVLAPARGWLAEQAEALAAELGEDAPDAARAALFAAYLDRRTPLPLLRDLRFHLRLYRAALEQPWVLRPGESRTYAPLYAAGVEAAGLDHPLAVSASQEALAEFLVEQTTLYHREEARHGTTRFAADRRLLPCPATAPVQLRLDLAVA